jgi:hypothetical protein
MTKYEIDPTKKYILLCSFEDMENLTPKDLEATGLIAAIAVEDGKIVDLEEVKKLIEAES